MRVLNNREGMQERAEEAAVRARRERQQEVRQTFPAEREKC